LSATVAGLLARARAAGVDRLDAQLLLATLLDQPRTWLMAHDDAAVPAAQAARFVQQTAERARGVPLAYLLGEREFHGLRLLVTPDVLVPRPDTEVLVDWALELLRAGADAGAGAGARAGAGAGAGAGADAAQVTTGGPVAASAARAWRPAVADLGTGSGAVALALKQGCPEARVAAVDLSAAALAVARRNGERLGLAVQWLQGDWFTPLVGQRFDLIASNPPYIAAGDPHLPALHAEPLMALSPGGDGLGALSGLCAAAPTHLNRGGWLLLEHGFDQAAAVRGLLQAAGFNQVCTRRDLAGQERCSGGRWPAAATS
jgi:release factor glutamine methyltransferase